MSNMTKTSFPVSLWHRLLAVFNLNDPQWGRPGNQQSGNKPSDAGNKDGDAPDRGDDSQEDENQRDNQRPGQKPGRDTNPSDAPPDLDEIWRDLSGRLGGLFGGGGKGSSGSSNRGGSSGGSGNGGNGWGQGGGSSSGNRRPPMQMSAKGAGTGLGLIVLLALVGWMATGIFTIQQGQKAVVFTFGKRSDVVGAGLQWRWPAPIQTHEVVATEQLRSVEIGNAGINAVTGLSNASMLTQDKNILDIRFTVQYRVSDIEQFLFKNAQPGDAVIFAAESAVREVVGSTPMDVVIKRESCVIIRDQVEHVMVPCLSGDAVQDEDTPTPTEVSVVPAPGGVLSGEPEQGEPESQVISAATIKDGRLTLAALIAKSIQGQLDKLGVGIVISNVNILDVQVPDKVKPAFDEARSATAEKASLINQGNAYANQRIASAEGVVVRVTQDAFAYKARITAQAQGDTQRFVQIYEQYRLAPDVTRNRMYLEAMQDIYGNVTKIVIEPKNNSLLYLPLDRLINQGDAQNIVPNASQNANSGPASGAAADNGNSTLEGTPLTDSVVSPRRSRDWLSRDRF